MAGNRGRNRAQPCNDVWRAGTLPSRWRAGGVSSSPLWRFAGASHLRLTSQEPSELVRCLLSLRGRRAGCLKLPVGSLVPKTRDIVCDRPGEGIVTCFVEYTGGYLECGTERTTPRGDTTCRLLPSRSLPRALRVLRRGPSPCPLRQVSAGICLSPPVPCVLCPGARCVSHGCPPLSRPPLPSPHTSLPSGLP